MKRTLLTACAAAVLASASLAHADAYDCFPACVVPAPAVERIADLCKVGVVREATEINRKLQPAKELYDIATNPTGFAIKLVDRHVHPIPAWVGWAMDPQGAARGYVMRKVRHEIKKQVGLQNECMAAGPGMERSPDATANDLPEV